MDQNKSYDLIVIGGGINGAAITRDAALRGIKVLLLEKNDFGSGASSKTSKLAHGGVRYLEQFEFGLVKESLRERSLLLKNASHLVKPLCFLFPVYKGDPHALWKVDLGLYLYEYLARTTELPKHNKLTPKNILQQIPGLKNQGLNGGCSFYDAQMLDHRIVIENVISAEEAGAKVCNHTEVIGLIKEHDRIQGVSYSNQLTGERGESYGKVIVNATGAWSSGISEMEPDADHCLPAPTKGIHLIVPQISSNTALLLHAPQDGRVFFVIPWGSHSLVGTTDTFYEGNPDNLMIEREDQKYLLDALNAYFPNHHFTQSSILSSFVGLRPLVRSQKLTKPSDIAREHVIQTSSGGLITVLGGKFTTHRLIAEQVVDLVAKELQVVSPCRTKEIPLPGAADLYSLGEVKKQLESAGVVAELVDHLLSTYGISSLKILNLMSIRLEESRALCKGYPHVLAELTYSIENEHVKSISDWFLRQTSMISPSSDCIEKVGKKLGSYFGWSERSISDAIHEYESRHGSCNEIYN